MRKALSFILVLLLCIESQLTIAQTCRNTAIDTEVSMLCKRVAITNIAKAGLRQICTLTTVTDPEFTAFLTQIKACKTPEINTFFETFGSNLPDLTIIVKDAMLVNEWKLLKERDVSLLAKIKIIKNTRTTNKQERINQLGNDPDRKIVILTEGEAAYELEEKYGYFERYQRVNPSAPKGDWISLSGAYKNKTFDELGGGFTLNALKMFNFDPKQKRKFFQSVDLHFIEADYVILNLTLMKKEVPAFYTETIQYIKDKYGIIKLINITK